MIIDYQQMLDTFLEILRSAGFSETDAETIAGIFTESTFDGVFSHGINRFPRFIGDVRDGTVDPVANPDCVSRAGALEQWDGNQAAGILNAIKAAERTVELASASGIGCVALRNTNHWMRGGTYGYQVAEKGLLFLGWTNTLPNMPPWGGEVAALGNNPLVIAIPRSGGHIVLDMAMSQYSYGKLEWMSAKGELLPGDGGFDRKGDLTNDPKQILATERILPTGYWKGSALALVLDLVAALLSGGNTTRQIGQLPAETNLSQVYIAVNMERIISPDLRESVIGETLDFIRQLNPAARFPGERSLLNRKKYLKAGIEIPGEIWDKVRNL